MMDTVLVYKGVSLPAEVDYGACVVFLSFILRDVSLWGINILSFFSYYLPISTNL